MLRNHTYVAIVVLLFLILPLWCEFTASGQASFPQRVEKDGVAIQFSVQTPPTARQQNESPKTALIAGSDVIVTLTLTDKTGKPLSGMRPNAWVKAKKSEAEMAGDGCTTIVRSLVAGSLDSRPDVALNSYLLLTLNHDNTVSFINPGAGLNRTRLETSVELPGPGADFALSLSEEFLYVTLPTQGSLAVINTHTRAVIENISLGPGARPARMYLQPNRRFLWIPLNEAGAIAAFDTVSNKLVTRLPVAAGIQSMAFSDDNKSAFVGSSGSRNISIIDLKALNKIGEIAVAEPAAQVAYSETARLVYSTDKNASSVIVSNPLTRKPVTTIPTKPGVVALRFAPAGRLGFLLNQSDSTISVFDSTTNKPVGSAEVATSPDQIVFTKDYAYVRGAASQNLTLFDLKKLSAGNMESVTVPAGHNAATAKDVTGVADMIAPTPEGNSVIIANSPDQMLYYYVEGMMAPMGSFTNYKRRPQGIAILDRSLKETSSGNYVTTIRLPAAGTYDVPVLLDQPRVVHCFSLTVAASPDGPKTAQPVVAVEPLFKDTPIKAGEPVTLGFSIADPVTKQSWKGLTDVEVLVFQPPGIWQQRHVGKEGSPGVYEIVQSFPHQGLFLVMLRIKSRGVNFSDIPASKLTVTE